MLNVRRPPEIDRIIDLKKFAGWVHDKRTEQGLSLEVLARCISDAGYPISQNKLYRLEQHLKEDGKRPLKTIDYELKIRLESVLGESFEAGEDDQTILLTDILALIKDLEKDVKARGNSVKLADDLVLRKVQTEMIKLLKKC
ncbi:MAG: hypothetical protein ACRBBN_12165 [Methyloligellaceae bacterium]